MAKHVKDYGAGVELFGSPDELVKLITTDKKEREMALESITQEGPPHKQVYSALLLKTMHRLVKELEKHSGEKFAPADGIRLESEKDEVEVPIPLVSPVITKQEANKIADMLSHSPAHEIAAFNTLLQAMNWGIKTLKANQD